jgi:hypothetical protein
MKRIVLVTMALLVTSPFVMSAQLKGKQTPQSFASFWIEFKAAVASGDKEAVSSMTELPFLYEGEELNKNAFIKAFGTIFDRRVQKCFPRAKPVKDGEYFAVSCGEAIFMFKKVNGEYRFVEIGVND